MQEVERQRRQVDFKNGYFLWGWIELKRSNPNKNTMHMVDQVSKNQFSTEGRCQKYGTFLYWGQGRVYVNPKLTYTLGV